MNNKINKYSKTRVETTSLLLFGRQTVYQNPVAPSPVREGSLQHRRARQDNPRILPICGQTSAFAKRHLHLKVSSLGSQGDCQALKVSDSIIGPFNDSTMQVFRSYVYSLHIQGLERMKSRAIGNGIAEAKVDIAYLSSVLILQLLCSCLELLHLI